MTASVAPMTDMQGPSTGDRRDDLGDQVIARYDVLGVGVELDSDDPTVIEVVEASYGIFRPVGDPADLPVPAARLQVRRTAAEWLVSGGKAEPRACRSADMAAVETLDRLVDTVQRGLHARGLISIHSAAVATAHGILVVAGASGQGKSTLALGLAHRGYGLLSDELSIVDGDGIVQPYPRSVHVRPDTIGLIPALGFLADRPRLTLGGGSEWALTPAELRERWDGMAPQAGPLAAILLLEGVPGAADPTVATVSPAIAALELTRSSWAASVAFGGTLARLADAASRVPCARLRSGPLEQTLDVVTDWLADAGLAPATDR
jgi:hypothetical protein